MSAHLAVLRSRRDLILYIVVVAVLAFTLGWFLRGASGSGGAGSGTPTPVSASG